MQFLKLRNEFRTAANPSAGNYGYLISLNWILKYKKYVHYDSLRRNLSPQFTSGHANTHPGKISNSDFLYTNKDVYLSGSGTVADKG